MARKFFFCFALICWTFFAGCKEEKVSNTNTAEDIEKPAVKKSAPALELKTEPKPAARENPQKQQRPPRVSMVTSMGEIVIELNEQKSPITVKNFLRYVREGFYDGLVFHRVIPKFMIQGGGFDSEMIEKPTHLPIRNEAYNGLKNYRGTIAMARKPAPDSATSQFFINVNNNTSLNYSNPGRPGYAVFGKVIKGMNVADAIVSVPTTTKRSNKGLTLDDNPVKPVFIESITVIPVLK